MTEYAVLNLRAAPADIAAVLLDPLALPTWNPAFSVVEGPRQPAPGLQYLLQARLGLTGTLEYTRISPDRIDISWQVPGMRETGSWMLEPHADGTIVRHEFEHAGPLAAALRHAFRGVAALRLERLEQQLRSSLKKFLPAD